MEQRCLIAPVQVILPLDTQLGCDEGIAISVMERPEHVLPPCGEITVGK